MGSSEKEAATNGNDRDTIRDHMIFISYESETYGEQCMHIRSVLKPQEENLKKFTLMIRKLCTSATGFGNG